MTSTKIELNCSKICRVQGLDELAKLLFPGNRNHQKIFLAISIDLKYAPGQFMPFLKPLCDKYEFTPRMLETISSDSMIVCFNCLFNDYGRITA